MCFHYQFYGIILILSKNCGDYVVIIVNPSTFFILFHYFLLCVIMYINNYFAYERKEPREPISINGYMKKHSVKISYGIFKIILPVYLAFLILLALLDYFAITVDKRNNMSAVFQSLQIISSNIERHIDTTNNYLFTIYQENTDFQALIQPLTYGETYSHAADLNLILNGYQGINNDLDGYFLIYGENKDMLGRMDYQIIPTSHQQALQQQVKELSDTPATSYQFTTQLDQSFYYVSLYQSGQISLAFITLLDKYIVQLDNRISVPGSGMLFYKGCAFNNTIKGLDKLLSNFLNTQGNQTIQIEGTCILGFPVQNADFWLLFETNNLALNQFSFITVVLVIMTFCFAISIIGTVYFIKRKISQPMYQLVDMMLMIQKGTETRVQDLRLPYYEMQLMNHTTAEMVARLKKQKEIFYEEKINRQVAELQFLQAQLSPHFYLNCLKMLNVKAYEAGQTELQDLILLISDYLRYCLGSVTDIVALEKELNLTEKYVELQRKISGRNIHCHIDMEKGLEKVQVPTFCVQSFVENSIKYARYSPNKDYLEIQIVISRIEAAEKKQLDIVVMDSGQGYDEKNLAEYNKVGSYNSEGVGINNIKQRIDILYGKKANYVFYNLEGAVSELILPLEALRQSQKMEV